MKTHKLFLFPFLLLLSGCDFSNKNLTNSKLIFSEFHSLNDTGSKIIEIFNMSDKSINLENYKLRINRVGYEDIDINLSGNIKSNDTFVIAKSTSIPEVLSRANFISDKLFWNGTQAVSLMKGNKTLDVIGTIGYQYDYGNNLDMCRKVEYLFGRKTYRPFDWIRYSSNDLSRIHDVYNVMSEHELMEGPHLTDEDFKKPFTLDDSSGLGGAVEVDLISLGDGDTTTFNFKNNPNSVVGVHSVRYLCIDTPEIQHGTSINEMPWGEAAKKFNNDILRQGKRFVIQSAPNYAIYETYGRVLGYVWVSFLLEPKPEDYVLVNYLIVKNGYSTLRFLRGDQKYDLTSYKGISYQNYMRNAEILAIDQKLKVHGEIDPNFKY